MIGLTPVIAADIRVVCTRNSTYIIDEVHLRMRRVPSDGHEADGWDGVWHDYWWASEPNVGGRLQFLGLPRSIFTDGTLMTSTVVSDSSA